MARMLLDIHEMKQMLAIPRWPGIIAGALLAMSSSALADDDGRQIMDRMISTYSELQSYADTGVVLVYRDDNEPPNETTFETMFSRPQFLKFSWVTHHPYPPLRHVKWRNVIWSNDSGSFSWHNYEQAPSAEREPSLLIAIAGATGVSSGSAFTVPVLLMPELGIPNELSEIRLVAVEDVEGTPCYHLSAIHPRGGLRDLWIGKSDHLLRKKRVVILGRPSDEIRRDIRVNQPIPVEAFTFSK